MTHDDYVLEKLTSFLFNPSHEKLDDLIDKLPGNESLRQKFSNHSIDLNLKKRKFNVPLSKNFLFGGHHNFAISDLPLEARLVIYGQKPMALINGTRDQLLARRNYLTSIGISCVFSPYEFIPNLDIGKGGYSNTTNDVRITTEDSFFFKTLLISRNENIIILGWLAVFFGWDVVLGHLLGFPNCCIKFFQKVWKKAKKENQGDVSVEIIKQSKRAKHSWYLNIFGRYFDHSLIHHFPCSFDCKNTQKISERFFGTLSTYEPEISKKLESFLQCPVVYSEKNGVFLFPSGRIFKKKNKLELKYNPSLVKCTSEGPLCSSIQSTNTLTSSETSKITVQGKTWDCFLIGFGNNKC